MAAAAAAAEASGGTAGEELVTSAEAKVEEAKASAAAAASDAAAVTTALDALAASAAAAAAAAEKAEAAHVSINTLAMQTRDEEDQLRRNKAAVAIQAHALGLVARIKYRRKQHSILKMQTAIRGFIAFTRYIRIRKGSSTRTRLFACELSVRTSKNV